MGPFQQSCPTWLKPLVMPLLVAVIEELGNSFEEECLDFTDPWISSEITDPAMIESVRSAKQFGQQQIRYTQRIA